MNDKIRSAIIGLFVLCAFAVISAILLFLKPTFGNGELSFRLRFVNIEKISVGTRVTLAGKPIGQVVSIKPVGDARVPGDNQPGISNVYSYELTLEVDSQTPIYRSDLFLSQTSGLLGERSVAIIPQLSKTSLEEIKKGDLVYASIAPSLEDAVERFGRLAIKTDEMVESLAYLVDVGAPKLQVTIDNFSTTSHLMRELLQECQEQKIAPSLAQASQQTGLAMEQIHKWLENLSHGTTPQDIQGILSHTNHILEAIDQPTRLSDLLIQLQMSAGQFHRLGKQINQSWPKLEKAFDQVAASGEHVEKLTQKAHTAIDQIYQVAEHVHSGQGSLGRLLMKDDLYLDLSQTMSRANIVLTDINNYGLLFQNNRTWKLQRAYQMDKLMALRQPQAFERYWKDQLNTVHIQLGQLSGLLEQAKKQSTCDIAENPNFQSALKTALQQLSDLQQQLSLFEAKLREVPTPATIKAPDSHPL